VAQASLSVGAGTPGAGGADLSGHVVEAFLTSYVGIGSFPVMKWAFSPRAVLREQSLTDPQVPQTASFQVFTHLRLLLFIQSTKSNCGSRFSNSARASSAASRAICRPLGHYVSAFV
jgi:hypothetical protein